MTTEQPTPDDLAEAERWLRDYANGWNPGYRPTPGDVRRVMTEYVRRGEELAKLRAQNRSLVNAFDSRALGGWEVVEVLRDEQ